MFLGISMRPLSWAMTLSVVALAIYLPFMAANWLAPMTPSALETAMRIAVSFFSVPFFLCLLHDKRALGTGIGSVFFYLYKYVFLSVGIAALIYWGITSGNLTAGLPVFGGLMTVVGLMVFYVSWRSDKRHDQDAGDRHEQPDAAPLDDQTEAILAAAQARAAQSKTGKMVLSES